ncbi:MAG: hypothetical protein KDC87_00605, partial [Planctomycetes bacterium]|nr:hypothetical protein [Planctomycetota bacterium]
AVQRTALEIEGWLDLGCAEHALQKLEALFALPGARPAALILRVRALVALGDFRAALLDLEEVQDFDHDPDWRDLTEAWCRKRIDDLPGAVQCMERLVARTHHSAIGHFNLGCYLALRGESSRALDEVSLACGLDPSFRAMLADESDLESLRHLPEFRALLDS